MGWADRHGVPVVLVMIGIAGSVTHPLPWNQYYWLFQPFLFPFKEVLAGTNLVSRQRRWDTERRGLRGKLKGLKEWDPLPQRAVLVSPSEPGGHLRFFNMNTQAEIQTGPVVSGDFWLPF